MQHMMKYAARNCLRGIRRFCGVCQNMLRRAIASGSYKLAEHRRRNEFVYVSSA
jgi:hypothetical protein